MYNRLSTVHVSFYTCPWAHIRCPAALNYSHYIPPQLRYNSPVFSEHDGEPPSLNTQRPRALVHLFGLVDPEGEPYFLVASSRLSSVALGVDSPLLRLPNLL